MNNRLRFKHRYFFIIDGESEYIFKAIPAVLNGRDVLGIAKTGSGTFFI